MRATSTFTGFETRKVEKNPQERAMFMLELAKRRAANSDSREDCRSLARAEIKFWKMKIDNINQSKNT